MGKLIVRTCRMKKREVGKLEDLIFIGEWNFEHAEHKDKRLALEGENRNGEQRMT